MRGKWIKEERVSALITAPVNKKRLQMIWPEFTGQTEWLADHIGGKPLMSFCPPNWNRKSFPIIFLATTHLPICSVAKELRNDMMILRKIVIAWEHLRKRGVKKPKIAVLGLNPHAGEDGMLGNEEKIVLKSVLQKSHRINMSIDGPFPADTFFSGSHRGYDGVVAMYHDQGLIPAKIAWGLRAVNVTLGLPIIRTSPGHGTAENVNYKDLDPSGMIAAIKVAGALAGR